MKSIIQIGNGKIALFHRQNFPPDVKVTALVVRDIEKHTRLAKDDKTLGKDVKIYSNITDAVKGVGLPLFWDIASGDETHFEYIDQILAVDNKANISLSKSPFLRASIDKLKSLVAKGAKISVTENYLFSNVTKKMREIIDKNQITHFSTSFDFTKNRMKDIANGRFIQEDCGIACYEGTHVLTTLHLLGQDIAEIELFDRHTELVRTGKGSDEDSGSVDIKGTTKKGDYFEIYMSMDGKVKKFIPELGIPGLIGFGNETRYRVVIVETKDLRIVGQFEPLHDRPRLLGRVLVYNEGKLVQRFEDIPENTLRENYIQQISFFEGKMKNPFDFGLLDEFEKIYLAFHKTIMD